MVKTRVRFEKDLCGDLEENILWEIMYTNKITLTPSAVSKVREQKRLPLEDN